MRLPSSPALARSLSRIAGAAFAIWFAACGGSNSTGPINSHLGSVRVSVATSGSDLDTGYAVILDAGVPQGYAIGNNTSIVVPALFTAVQHTVSLGGIDRNCAVSGSDSQVVDVRANDTISVAFAVDCHTPTPLRDRIVFAQSTGSDSMEIFVADTDGANATPITQVHFAAHPRVSPDGSEILFNNYVGLEISGVAGYAVSRMRADGSNLRRVATPCAFSKDASWSRDGTRIAFVCDSGGAQVPEVWTMNSDGSTMKGLTNLPPSLGIFSPVWSPDGNRIAFVANDALYVVNADGSGIGPVPVTDQTYSVDWSPTGDSLLCLCALTSNNFLLRVITPDGAVDRVVSSSLVGVGFDVAWAPDGKRIVTDGDQIYTVHSDGTHQVAITTNGGYQPAWSP